MKIYLLNPPFVKNYIRSSRCTWIPIAGSNWYPIFLAYATGLLENHGHRTKLVDAPVERLSHQNTIEDIKDFSPDIIVIYTSLDSLENEITLAGKIKENTNALVVFVGPWCSIKPEDILKKGKGIDAVIRREFDYPLLNIANGMALEDIQELTWKKNGEIIHNPDGSSISSEQLDEFPFVTQVYSRHLNIHNYRQTSLLHPFVDLFTARGCSWGKCTFCLWPHTIHKGAKYRMRSIDSVIAEFRYIKEKIPFVKEIFIQDDTLPKGRAREISQAILENDLKISWSAYSKTDLDLETLSLMKQAGCRFLHVGYETSNVEILKDIKKGQTREMMEEFTLNAQKADIRIHGDFVLGFPGETKETIQDTIQWAKKLRISDYQFVIPQPHPTTPLYDWLVENNYLNKDGEVDYPHLTSEELSYWRFKAYKMIYLSPSFAKNMLFSNVSEVLRILKIAMRVFPHILKLPTFRVTPK